MSRIGKLKDKFLRAHPGYRKTIYPLQSSDYNSNMWRSDPNNNSNSDWWDIPWPPYAGELPFSNGWQAPEEEDGELSWATSEERVARSKSRGKDKDGGKAKKRSSGEAYAESGEKVAVGDTADEAMESDAVTGGGKRKRRKMSDVTYRPPRRAEPDSDDEMVQSNAQLVSEDHMHTAAVTSPAE